MRDPLGRLFPGLPRGARVALDWFFTIAGAVLIVFALKAWIVNPYRIPSSSMEPTLHCARPALGCEARFSDRVLANRFIYHFRDPKRGEIIVFKTPPEAGRPLRRRRDLRQAPDRAARRRRQRARRLRLHQRREARRAVHQAGQARQRAAEDVAAGSGGSLLLHGRQPHGSPAIPAPGERCRART